MKGNAHEDNGKQNREYWLFDSFQGLPSAKV
jgi:hypothetical protein